MPRTRQTSAQLLTLIALILGAEIIQSEMHWNFAYQMDEVWRVHTAIDQTWREILYQRLNDIGNPIGEMLLLNVWVGWVGYQPVATRALSMLFSLLTLALLIRLLLDRFDLRSAQYGTLLLGVLPVYAFYGRDAGPYPVLAFAALATTFLFVRWFYTGRAYYMVVYVAVGILGIYHQYAMAFVVVGHAVALCIFSATRWRKLVYGFTAFAAVALALILGYGLPFLQMFSSFQFDTSGALEIVSYLSNIETIHDLHRLLNDARIYPLVPFVIAALGIGIFPQHSPDLIRLKRRIALPLTILTAIVMSMWLVGFWVPFFHPKTLLIVVPLAAGISGVLMTHMPAWFRFGYLGMALIPLFSFSPYFDPGAQFIYLVRPLPTHSIYQALTEKVTPNSVYVVEDGDNLSPAILGANFQLRRFLPYPLQDTQMMFYLGRWENWVNFPHQPERWVTSTAAEVPAWFPTFIESADQLFWLELVNQQGEPKQQMQSLLGRSFFLWDVIPVSEAYPNGEQWEFTIFQYRRIPDLPTNAETLFRFNDAITLENWRLADVNVTACQPVLIESWWQTDEPLPANYALSYSLIAPDGGVTLTDHNQLSTVLSLQWQPDEFYYDGRSITLP
ncbi:MAG: glycosyltransferase family 39 protein, partial [Phototrophicaceae bacterium]